MHHFRLGVKHKQKKVATVTVSIYANRYTMRHGSKALFPVVRSSDKYGYGSFVWLYGWTDHYIFLNKKDMSFDTIAHECSHTVSRIFKMLFKGKNPTTCQKLNEWYANTLGSLNGTVVREINLLGIPISDREMD